MDEKEFREIVLENTIQLEKLIDSNRFQSFKFLSDSIYQSKKMLKVNTVDFIIAKVLTKKKEFINLESKDFIDIYILGNFRKEFTLIAKVSEVLVNFYLEMTILPNVKTISRKQFLDNTKFSVNQIKNGVIIYDRERNLY